MVQEFSIAGGLLFGLLVAMEVGFQCGRRVSRGIDPAAGGQIGAIQGAIIGLLGLLLAFSFAAAGSRFLERQDLIVKEANAIGTASLRADLLDEPHRSGLRRALKRYTEHRIEAASRLRAGLSDSDAAMVARFHQEIWAAASAGVAAKPATMLGVLPPVNDVIDLHTSRVFAGKKHLPMLVLGLLIACSVLSIGTIGFGCGTAGRRRISLTLPLTFLIWASLWITIDLDHPRAGLLRLSDEPLRALKFEGVE